MFVSTNGRGDRKVLSALMFRLPVLVALVSVLAAAAVPASSAVAAPPSWTAVASPSPGAQQNQLNGVSCTSATSCVAVGLYDYGASTLIESWNGSTWAVVPSPSEGDNSDLFDVSCTNPEGQSDCFAVGTYRPTNNKGAKSLIESFDGTAWSIVPSPNSTRKNVLFGISCTGETFCMAVGYSGDLGPDPMFVSLVETWNGTDWSVGAVPNIAALSSVSCVSSSDCTAAGQHKLATWNGVSWKVRTTSVGSKGFIGAVTCTSDSDCAAVGQQTVASSPYLRTLVLLWQGGNWSVIPSPNEGPSTGKGGADNQLLGVSCTSTTKCVAVGDAIGSLVETWNGKSWKIAPSENLGLTGTDELNGSSCASPTSCQAVGDYGTESANQTLVETGSD